MPECRLFDPPADPDSRELFRGLIEGNWVYRLVGQGQRRMQFLPNGSIGEGSAELEAGWMLRGSCLIVFSAHRYLTFVAWHCPDGVWRGQWLYYESCLVELLPEELLVACPDDKPLRSPPLAKSAVAFTHCEDWCYEASGCRHFEASFKRFHPDIPLVVFKSKELDQFKPWDPRYIIPQTALLLADKYDLLVHFDADSLVCDQLDYLFAGQYTVAGVKNNNYWGQAGDSRGIDNEDADVGRYVNCGLVASTSKEFWQEWLAINNEEHNPEMGEQDNLNHLLYRNGCYGGLVLDKVDKKCFYGVASQWGSEHRCDSWRHATVNDGHLCLSGKRIKVLHQAGGEMPKEPWARWFRGPARDFVASLLA
jgi:hypothetical protein